MPNLNCKLNSDLKLNLSAWSASAVGLTSSKQWTDWAYSQSWPVEGSTEVSNIPALMRRRMSSLSKYAVQTALTLLKSNEVNYLVFVSRHGELAQSASLIENILQGGDASPMAFSHSVHNTASGLTTIAAKKDIPVTSLAASNNSFQMGIVEAYAYLVENPTHQVLLVDFDEPLPKLYAQYETQYFKGYALGMILSIGEQFQIVNTSASVSPSKLPQGLIFLTNFLTNKKEWCIASRDQAWKWMRKS